MNENNKNIKESNKNIIEFADLNETFADADVYDNGFTMVPNEIIVCTELSDRARLLLIYLLMHAKIPGWKFHDSVIRKILICGVHSLENAFKELKKIGYVKVIPQQSKNGNFTGSKRIFSRIPKFKETGGGVTRCTTKNTGGVTECIRGGVAVAVPPPKIMSKDNKSVEKINCITESPESGNSVDGDSRNRSLRKLESVYNNNNIVNNTKILKTTTYLDPKKTQSPPNDVVVISLDDILRENAIFLNQATRNAWVEKYGEKMILEKIEYMKTQKIRSNPSGFLRTALLFDFKPSHVHLDQIRKINAQKAKIQEEKIDRIGRKLVDEKNEQVRQEQIAKFGRVLSPEECRAQLRRKHVSQKAIK